MQSNHIERRQTIERRQVLRLLGAGVVLGGVTGTVSAGEGRFIVGASSRAATRAARAEARSVHRVLDFGPFGQAVAGTFSREALRGLSRRPDVRYVEPDGLMYAIAMADLDSADGEIGWGVDRVDAEKVWDADADASLDGASVAGSGAHVAIIDSGIDNDHPDLQANLGNGVSFTVGPFWRDDSSTDPKDWDDGNGHGTHCAGIAAAVKDAAGVVGVAPEATLHAVKVLDNSGSGSWSDVAAGIEWVGKRLELGEWTNAVASMSLGGGHSDTVETAVQYAASQGVLLVAAAGNDGPDTADSHYPSAYPEVVSVAATERYTADSGELFDSLAYFSSTGSTVEISAPGRSIYSTYKGGGYKSLSGTSMACPHVSGAGALLLVNGYDAASARSQLTSTAESPVYDGEAGRDLTAEETGHGMLDVLAAIDGSSGGGGGTEDTTAPTFTDASATDATDGDGTVADGDQITVSATVTDSESGIASVTTDASPFGGSSSLSLSNGGSGDTYTATFTVDASSTTDGTYAITVTATDGASTPNTASTDTNTLTLDTSGGDTGGTDTTAPVVDDLTATEAGSPNPKAEVTPTATVSDDMKLASVRFVLFDGSTELDRDEVTVSGTVDTVSGYLEAGSGRNKMDGKTLTVSAVAVDAAGNESVAVTTTVEA